MDSRLSSMQATFRQRQAEEKEHKLLQLLDSQQQRGKKAGMNGVLPPKYKGPSPTPAIAVGQPGKVRQMFEERRTGRGIDKSYPLEPLQTPPNLNRKTPSPANIGSSRKSPAPLPLSPVHKKPTTLRTRAPVTSPTQTKTSPVARPALDRSATYSKPTPTTTVGSPTRPASFPIRRQSPMKSADENGNELIPRSTKYTDYAVEFESTVREKENELGRKLRALTLLSSTTEPVLPTPPVRRSVKPAAPVQKAIASKRIAASPSKTRTPSKPPPGTLPCTICGRCFASDRLEKHEAICKKNSTKKRKVFDPTKMRMEGTEAEPYLRIVSAKIKKNVKASQPAPSEKNQGWRKKHEEFIRTIRLAKEYNAHVAKGGNPADLPPPPPSDTSDYIQCPHCGRKFAEGAASRHIPKCASIKSNKR